MNELKAPVGYQPVPVDIARQIAEECVKDVVVIMSIDRTFDKTHFTTYGRSADDKVEAAQFGELISAGLQCGGPLQYFEDFRAVDAAKRAERINNLTSLARRVVDECRGAFDDFEDMAPEWKQIVLDLEAELAKTDR